MFPKPKALRPGWRGSMAKRQDALPPLTGAPRGGVPGGRWSMVEEMGLQEVLTLAPKRAKALPVSGLTGKTAMNAEEKFYGDGSDEARHQMNAAKRRSSAITGAAESTDDKPQYFTKKQKHFEIDPTMTAESKASAEVGYILKLPPSMHDRTQLANQLREVKNLDLAGKWFRDSGLMTLVSALETNKTVRKIDIGRNDLSAKYIEALCLLLIREDCKIRHIELTQNRIGTEGAKVLAYYLPQMRLKHLGLFRNNISAQGIAALAKGLRQNDTLITLECGGNYIKYGPHAEAMEDTVYLRSIATKVNLCAELGTISTLDYGEGKRNGLQTSKYTDGRLLETQWKDGHIARGRMHYPNGDTFEISEGGEDGVPANGTYYIGSEAKSPWYAKLGVVLGSSVNVIDYATDVNVLVTLFIAEQWEFFAFATGIVVLTTLVSSRGLWKNGRRWAAFFQLFSVVTLYDAITMVSGARLTVRNFDLHQKEVLLGYASINQLKLTEALMESAPQAFFQIFIILQSPGDEPALALLLSVALALSSLAGSLANTDRRSLEDYARSEHNKNLRIRPYHPRFIMILLYRFCEVAARSILVGAVAAAYLDVFPYALGAAYIMMYAYWWAPGAPLLSHLAHLVTKFNLIWYSLLVYPGLTTVCPPWVKKEPRLRARVFFAVRLLEEAGIFLALWYGEAGAVIDRQVVLWGGFLAAAKYVLTPFYLLALLSATRSSYLVMQDSLNNMGAFSRRLGLSTKNVGVPGDADAVTSPAQGAKDSKAPATYTPTDDKGKGTGKSKSKSKSKSKGKGKGKGRSSSKSRGNRKSSKVEPVAATGDESYPASPMATDGHEGGTTAATEVSVTASVTDGETRDELADRTAGAGVTQADEGRGVAWASERNFGLGHDIGAAVEAGVGADAGDGGGGGVGGDVGAAGHDEHYDGHYDAGAHAGQYWDGEKWVEGEDPHAQYHEHGYYDEHGNWHEYTAEEWAAHEHDEAAAAAAEEEEGEGAAA